MMQLRGRSPAAAAPNSGGGGARNKRGGGFNLNMKKPMRGRSDSRGRDGGGGNNNNNGGSRSRSRSRSWGPPRMSRSRSRSRGGGAEDDRSRGGASRTSRGSRDSRSRGGSRDDSNRSGGGSRGSRDGTPRGERKDKLMVNYQKYESTRSGITLKPNSNSGVRVEEDELDGWGLGTSGRSSGGRAGSGRGGGRGGGWLNRRGLGRGGRGGRGSSRGRNMQGGRGEGGGQRRFFSRLQQRRNANNSRPGSRGRDDEELPDRDDYFDSDNTNNINCLNNKDDSTHQHHPWILPPHLKLAPRIDIWLAFTIASLAAVSSIGQVHVETSGFSNVSFGQGDKFALSTCCISFILSFFTSLGLRYGPARMALTRNLFANVAAANNNGGGGNGNGEGGNRRGRRNASRGMVLLASLNITMELLLLAFLAIFWMASMPIIVNGNAYYNSSRDGGSMGVPLAMAGSDIWNANLFYSSWFSFLLCVYLFVEVHTLSDRRGTLKADKKSRDGSSVGSNNNTFTKRWTLLTFTSLIIMIASISTYGSPMCSGQLLKQTAYCRRALMGILLGGLLQLLLILAVVVLYRLSHMDPGVLNSRMRNSRNPRMRSMRVGGDAILSVRKLHTSAAIVALVSLIVQSVNVAMLTSPTGGGPGNISGTLYFGSWLGFVLVFELCLRYLEYFSTSDGARQSINLIREDLETEFEDEEDENDNHLMLRNGSEDGSRRGAKNRGGAIPSTRNLVVVEDVVSVQDENVRDELDEQSFVFGPVGGGQPAAAQPALQAAAAAQQQPDGSRGGSRSKRRSKSRSKSPKEDAPSISTNQHFGGGRDPDEESGGSKLGSLRSGRRRSGSPSERSSRALSSGSDPMVESIDVRSAQRSRSGESSKNADPEGNNFSEIDRKWSGHYTDVNDIIGTGGMMGGVSDSDRLGDSAYFDKAFDAHATNTTGHRRSQSGGVSEPDGSHAVGASMVFTSFHMDQVEKLDDPQDVEVSPPTPPRHPSNLSPLDEVSGEDTSPNADNSPETPTTVEVDVPTKGGGGEVGDNLRTMQAMRGVMLHVQNQQQQQRATDQSKTTSRTSSSKKSGSKSSSSRDRGLGSLGVGGRGIHGSQGQVSRHSSRQSTASKRTVPSISTMSKSQGAESVNLTDCSEQGGAGGGSGKHASQRGFNRSRKSSSGTRSRTSLSSRGMSSAGGGSAILTEDGDATSASNPPPTISDGVSTKDGLSEFSGLTENNDQPQGGAQDGNNIMGGGGPPPPPFRRSVPTHPPAQDFDNASQYSSSAPLRSIHTNKGSNGDADTIVSDPTLDAGLVPSPKPKSSKSRSRSGSRSKKRANDQYKESSSTNSYDKKYSDETDAHSTSDENPSSREGGGGNKVVDNIVAAALAYAEKAHGESDNHGLGHRGSGTTSGGGSRVKPPAPMRSSSSSNNQRTKMRGRDPSTHHLLMRASTGTRDDDASSSIHSFYTESDAGAGAGGGGAKSHSTGNPRYTGPGWAAPVDDLVAKALSHAQGQIQSKHTTTTKPVAQAQQHRQVPTMKMERTKSDYSSQYWSRDASKSAGSMYSEDDDGTEFSGQDGGMHFDC